MNTCTNEESDQKNTSGCSERSVGANKVRRSKKRRRSSSDLESEFEDCDMQNAIEIERNLRKVAKKNSLSDEEMRKLLQKFVNNDHILALVTLKAEDEVARERREEADQRAIIITDTPSVAKLTRAKARELNKTPGITFPSLVDTPQTDIATLIKDDLHSDEDDEEYTFKEEDFISDEDPNTTASDMDSNPRTPQTPLSQAEYESPVKLTADGCFKIPLEKGPNVPPDLRIATRTRSKFCLQQTTIEDIQSEFVPPDVEQFDAQDAEVTAPDVDWMEFLNDFAKPLNCSFLGDDDDPINDPEYVAAEQIAVDAEELRDVNISKKELTELVAELFEGLINEGVSLESVDLETTQKFAEFQSLQTPRTSPGKQESAIGGNNNNNNNTRIADVSQRFNFDEAATESHCVSDATISSTNITQSDLSFYPNVMSTPGPVARAHALVPVANVASPHETSSFEGKTITLPTSSLSVEPELIAVPVPGQPNCYQLARVVATGDGQVSQQYDTLENSLEKSTVSDTRYTTPYDNNFTWEYISIRKHVYAEYMDKFENLRQAPSSNVLNATALSEPASGFTAHQHELLQQQLRLHVQLTTQSFLQTYSHPDHWRLASKAKEMLEELHQKASTNATFNVWNLQEAMALVAQWECDLSVDSEANKELMSFQYKEIERTNRNTRQICRFAPQIMDVMLNSCVFMYPQYLPRIAFGPKTCSYHIFSPAESQLIAMGLEKHMKLLREKGERLSKKASPLLLACERLSKDTVFGKTKRRIWDHIKMLRKSDYYNPIKYYFEHNRAPPSNQELFMFENNVVLPPKEHFYQLPLVWQEHITMKSRKETTQSEKKSRQAPVVTASEEARVSYLEFVREAIGGEIDLLAAATESLTETTTASVSAQKRQQKKTKKSAPTPTSLTININYVFGSSGGGCLPTTTTTTPVASVNASTFCEDSAIATTVKDGNSFEQEYVDVAPVAFNYDCSTQVLQPITELEEGITPDFSQSKSLDLAAKDDKPSAPLIKQDIKPTNTLNRQSRRKCGKRFKVATLYRDCTQRLHNAALKHRKRRRLKRRFLFLFTLYQRSLLEQKHRYRDAPVAIRLCYSRFRALELYTDLLVDLKMFCARNAAANVSAASTASSPGATILGKRGRTAAQLATADDETAAPGTRTKKSNRQEESFRHMLLPDSVEDANRKDAIYALNFYEKVEEALKSSNRPDDCNKFNHILKTFDPKRDKVSDLYNKLEQLLLPEHPELAQIFLTFLLPVEAAEIGKFFEHFMITNMSTFLNKLNVYFNKQPAQIRKVYNCLNELAEDPKVTMKKLETKILPLLKGNQFLIDWFMQQFPDAAPPERLLPTPEHIGLKEVQSNRTGQFTETVINLLESPTSDQNQGSGCQLRYINGRIYYGSKMTLPAKLSFMAASYHISEAAGRAETKINGSGCIHGVREYGEQRLKNATTVSRESSCTTDDSEKSEEDDGSKGLVIDMAAPNSSATEDGESSSSIETCDDHTLRAHAVRLNPSYYGTSCYTANTSTPNHHTRKWSLNFGDIECKISPRKNSSASAALLQLSPASSSAINAANAASATTLSMGGTANNCVGGAGQVREKRKSPTKKAKSPVAANAARGRAGVSAMQPMVVIHTETRRSGSTASSAIACAKKLKSLIDSESSDCGESERLAIVARTKQPIKQESDKVDPIHMTKVQKSDDLEFLNDDSNVSVTLSQKSFPAIVVADTDTSMEESDKQESHVVASTHIEVDEDCKLDIVASLAANSSQKEPAAPTPGPPLPAAASVAVDSRKPEAPSASPLIAWTREEDKNILIEKLGSQNHNDLFQRIQQKLPTRSLYEIRERHQFLMEFLSKLQGK